MVEIKVLGPIEARRNGEPVDIGGPAQRRLLASLIARPGQVVSVTGLLDDLWGDNPPPSGPASIQSYVSRLRRALGVDVIETIAPGYRLGNGRMTIDSIEFAAAAASLPEDPASRLEAIESALAMWQGPAFEDFDHVDFASRSLQETRYRLEEERARCLAANGESAAAIAALEKVTAAERLRESAWVDLGLVLARSGRQAEAVRALDSYRSHLIDIGLEPGPAFEAAETEVFATRTQGSPRPALPQLETSFVGREDEAQRIRELMADHRLVTIVGPGGMGKTRLAIELAASADTPLPVLVRLDALRDHHDVAPAVLQTLGGETRGEPVESVVAHLSRADPVLLVLDSAERVIESAATLVAEIVRSTDTHVLTTSREPLSTSGEVVMTLGPLDPGSAIELYRDRARRVEPSFEAPTATLDMLCEELDYMPLAIEMAAARSKALAPEEILTRLSRRFGLLDKPLRGGAERHRSLDALVDWSYDLLEPSEQRVFERVSVIAGTFDVELATAVAGFGSVNTEGVAGMVAGLVEKSLINRSDTGRFRMLRVLKSYANQKLNSGGDETDARTIHARWFGELATAIGNGLSTPEEMWWIARANETIEDMGSALSWSAETSDLDAAQSILEGLFDWFYHRQPPAIVGWGDVILPVSRGHDVRSVASAWAALAAMKTGSVDQARQMALAGTDVDSVASRFAWFMTGEVACYQDRLADALSAYRKQLVRASSLNDRIGVVDAMAGETLALAFQGMFDRATDVAADLEEIVADIGAPTYQAYANYTLGEAVIESDPERSAEVLERAVGLASSVNNQYIQAMARTTLGSVLGRLGRFEEARSNLWWALEMWETMGLTRYRWTAVQYLAALLAEQGDTEPAVKLLAATEQAGRRPFGGGQRHWSTVVEALKEIPEYSSWAAEGSALDLAAASELALSATRPRR